MEETGVGCLKELENGEAAERREAEEEADGGWGRGKL
jgi:hypothetical protein